MIKHPKNHPFNSALLADSSMPGDLRRVAGKHYQAIVESSRDAIIGKDLKSIVTSWNLGAQTLFGYIEQEMLGQSMLRLLPPEKLEEEHLILTQILAGEKIEHFNTVRLHKDGHRLDVSVTISPVRNRQGRIVGTSMIARDISEQVRLERIAQQCEAIVQSSVDAIIAKTLDGIIISWNPAAHTMFGYCANEMVGKSMRVLIPPDRPDEEDHILEKLRRGEKIEHFETKRMCNDGRLIDISVTISPIRNGQGDIIGASKIARDITYQKLMERRLHLTASVFAHTNEAIVITDTAGFIVETNQAFSNITGYSREDVVGKDPKLFIFNPGPEQVASLCNALNAAGHYQTEVWSRRKDGQAYAGLLSVSSVLDEAGRVEGYVALMADNTSLRLKQERIEHLAHFDALTDLPNRILLSDRLHQAIATSHRYHQCLAVLYLDLDGFKAINDMHGHEVGDQFLIEISRRMSAVMRENDTLARIGGDEFVVILVDVKSAYDCAQLTERLLKTCAKPVAIHEKILQISASIGVTMTPQDSADADQLIRHADQAMYQAKHMGKNNYHLYDAAIENEVKSRSLQLDRIEQALKAGEFVLYYQPKVSMRTGAVFGVEALIRWRHPERGVLCPVDFLSVIKSHPLNESIGELVFESALTQMEAWRKTGIVIPVSINIDSRQLKKTNFTSQLVALLAKYPDINPQDIELEILETSALHDIDAVSLLMRNCHALGVHFAIDDFGTGYSSLSYLKLLPAETIKIDQSFVRNILSDHEDLVIVKGVIALAAAFGRKVIAEGVETVEIGNKLLDFGCDLAQGFVISKPMPGDQVPQWISQWRSYSSWREPSAMEQLAVPGVLLHE